MRARLATIRRAARERSTATRRRRAAWRIGWLAFALGLGLASPGAARETFPPSPYDILASQDLDTPPLDAVPFCIPEGLDPAMDPVLEQAQALEWHEARETLAGWVEGLDRPTPELVVLDAVLLARGASDREDLLIAERRFRDLLLMPMFRPHQLCARLELSRVLLMLSRESEAAAQLTIANRVVEELPEPSPHADEIAFQRAEILYRTNRPFDAHLVYRKLAKRADARLALASRLRLTDLSFDAAKIERVSVEYESLLPRASAFGASTHGWALRASEAALDVGDPSRALRWVERYLEGDPSRDGRDAAEIRMADFDVAFDDPLGARKRLSAISGRRRGDEIGALAAIRAIDLGVAAGSPDQRLEILLMTLRQQRHGVRRYALGVLMSELAHRGDLDGALAVATRLAYEGLDPVVTPGYAEQLDELLAGAVRARQEGGSCQELVRALGGRYGILIERASQPGPFAAVGGCFEEMELPWLAATVYRAIARRFGAPGAQTVALPLARSSLAIGEVELARRVATAALETPDEDAVAWRAIVAEADFVDGRHAEAAAGLRTVLEAPEIAAERGRLVRMLGLTLESNGDLADATFIAERAPAWLEQGDAAPGAHASLVEALMLAAHAQRRAGRSDVALSLYRSVDRHAGAGSLRSSARFWLGIAGAEDADGAPAWGDDPNISLGSPWGRLALFERHFEPLWSSYGEVVR